jgi:hypothetical protein
MTGLVDFEFFHQMLVKQCCQTVVGSGGSSEEATEAVPPQIKLNKKKIKNIILN